MEAGVNAYPPTACWIHNGVPAWVRLDQATEHKCQEKCGTIMCR